ncbi:MAG: hypothetical protein ACPLW8_06330, partial [Candidatus Bathyarchaeales archaeon]
MIKMVEIPSDEKIIYKRGLLGKFIITDKAVYKKGIISPLERYDFNDIICIYGEKEKETKTYHPDRDEESPIVSRKTTVTERIKMILSNGKIVELSSQAFAYGSLGGAFFEFADSLGPSGLSLEISKAIKRNLPPGKLLFIPFNVSEDVIKMIKEQRSPEEIREELRKIMIERQKRVKELNESPLVKAINFIVLIVAAAVSSAVMSLMTCFIVELLLMGMQLHVPSSLLESLVLPVGLLFFILLMFLGYSRMRKM